MNHKQTSAVLAGLRLLQANFNNLPEGINGIFNDGGMNDMTLEDIDQLCENLNGPDYMVIAIGNPFDGLRLVGPFFGGLDAANYADGSSGFKGIDDPYHIVRLDEPEEDTV